MTASNPSEQLLARVLVPLADDDDARATAAALEPYAPEQVIACHVVEKGEGVPDKTPVEQSEQIASEAFAALRETFPDAETEIAYGRDVVATIIETAAAVDASAIAFRPRESGRIERFLSGDRSLDLVVNADRPVIALPHEAEQ
jgi:nucleotide-binding universal stress UspA family protein